MMGKINNLQKTLIHIGISDLGISDEDYRIMLSQRFNGAASCLGLTYQQASAFIDELKKKGFKIKRKSQRRGVLRNAQNRSAAPNVIFLPSRQQMGLIEHLRHDVHWRVHDGYFRWIEKFLGRAYIKNDREANKVIEALKAMKKRGDNADTDETNVRPGTL